MSNADLLQIDLDAILRARMSVRKSRMLPRFVTRLLERVICQDELNTILRVAYPDEGSAFALKVLQHLGIEVSVKGEENLQPGSRYVFASNHPLGGLDGITLISVFGRMYGDEHICFLVNDLLMNVRPLRNVFLPINKYGSQGRAAAAAISAAYSSDDKQILIFPAGLVSRKHRGGEIKDLEWKKTFVMKAMQTERQIVPVHFSGLNTARFYNLAGWRKRLRIPVNLEQALLPSELMKARGARYTVTIGKPILQSALRKMVDKDGPVATALSIKRLSEQL